MDSDPGDPKTRGSDGSGESGSATLVFTGTGYRTEVRHLCPRKDR